MAKAGKRQSKRRGKRKTTNVYVIELRKEVLKRRKFVDANPDHVKGMACLYVGMSSRSPAERFEQHLNGYKANRYARDFGFRLRSDLFEHLNPMTRADAEEMEYLLARDLQRRGYAVWQN